jgi:L-rhamnonate dehydratase
VRLTGTMDIEGPYWEDRGARALDVYDDEAAARAAANGTGYLDRGVQLDDRHLRISSLFLEVESDDGAVGRAGPVSLPAAWLAMRQLRPILAGLNPAATEHAWDLLYRSLAHGHQGDGMLALSAVDCALWDLRGKLAGQPAYRLLGGPTRSRVPAYASLFGHSVSDLGLVRERAQRFRDLGFRAQKWFLRNGVADGRRGLRHNVAVVRTVRETLGDDYEIMVDVCGALDLAHAREFADRIAEFRPRWLEEPLPSEQVAQYAELRRATSVPISGGEHAYTRWGARELLEAGAVDCLQPDIYWAGGLSETVKIAALASAWGVPVMPHAASTHATLQFSLSQSPGYTQLQEYLVKFDAVSQYFLTYRIKPDDGWLYAPGGAGAAAEPGDVATEPGGLAMELDEDKIEAREIVDFG